MVVALMPVAARPAAGGGDSFSQLSCPFGKGDPNARCERRSSLLLGDVVISADTAAREGEAAGTDLQERLLQLLIHGILHLFGYDHETNEDDARRMEAKAQALRGLFEAA